MANNEHNMTTRKDKTNDHSTLYPQLAEYCSLASLPSSILHWIDRNMDGFITILDQHGVIRYISQTVESLFGFQVKEITGTKWYKWVSAENISYIQANVDLTQHQQQTFNIYLEANDGKHIWTENVVTRIHDQANVYYVVATNDKSDQKEVEDMMVQSEKMSVTGQLAAGIAHEIRNPLTSLKGFVQLLQAGVNSEEAFYQIMIDEIEKMENITSELLFISKPMTNQKDVQNMSAMLDDVVTLLKPQADLKSIHIQQTLNEEQTIECDRSQFKQVFINLLKNGIEAMEDPGYIMIVDQSDQNDIIIDVTDEGPGISEEMIHKLGEPFFTTKQNGTGLGLMITRQILKSHGGRLDILPNDDEGSTFRVIFPQS